MDEFSWEDNITNWKDFSGLEIIGHGTFGTVYRASAVGDRVIGGYFALKVRT